MVCNRFIPVTNVCMAYDEAHDRYSITSERTRFRQRDCRVSRVTCGTQNCCRVLVCPTQEINVPKQMHILPFPLWNGFNTIDPPEVPLGFVGCFPLAWNTDVNGRGTGQVLPQCISNEGTGAGVVGEFYSDSCGLAVQGTNGSGLSSGMYYWTGISPPTQDADFYTEHIVDNPHVLIEFGYEHWFVSAPGLMPSQMGGVVVGGPGPTGRVDPFPDTMSLTISNNVLMFYPDVNGTFTLTWDRGAYYYFGVDAVIGVKLGLTGANRIAYGGPSTNPSFPLPLWGNGGANVSGADTADPFSVTWDDGLGFTATMTEV